MKEGNIINPTVLLQEVFGQGIFKSKRMCELLLCLTQQGLNEYPWAINLSEYLFLEKLK